MPAPVSNRFVRLVRNRNPAARLHAPFMTAIAAAIPGPGIGPARAPPSVT